MNIGINTRFLLADKPLEGIGRYTYELVSRLVKNYPQHKYYFFFDRKYDESFIFSENVVPVIVHPMARHPFLFYTWFEISLPYNLNKYKIDVFFSPDNFLSLKTKVPTVLTLHDLAYMVIPKTIPFMARKYYRYFMPRFLKRADIILPVSNYVKEELIRFFPEFEEKSKIAYNALPTIYKQQSKIIIQDRIREDYFIIIGSINKRKNTLNVLKAFENFTNKIQKPFKIILAGRKMGNQSEELNNLIDKLKNENRLLQLDNLSDEEMISFLKGSKALIFVSLYEGFGIPILEAFACNIPVITSNVYSMPEVAGDAALYVNPLNIENITNAMIRIEQDDLLRQNLIEAGNKQLQKFKWEDSVQVLYESLCLAGGKKA